MQYDLKQLEKQYKEKPIQDCVELAKQWNEEIVKRGEELVGLLWYLEKSKRYHEWDGYKKLPFKVFVWEVCHIPYNRYRELAYAYNWYPVEARELGPTTIQTIRNKVGVVKMPQVLSEIKATAAKIKNPEKKREAISQVIEKHAPKPKPKTSPMEDSKAYWKKKYDDLMVKYKALEKENDELRERLAKQEGPVKAFLAMKEAVEPMLSA